MAHWHIQYFYEVQVKRQRVIKRFMKCLMMCLFLAVGTGPQWEYYNNQIKDEERELIRMMGRRDDVDEIYQICDLTVLTSNHGEGISNSIMESMAWGVPVIATNKGGTPEIVEDNVNGRLINEQTPDVVSDIITSLLDTIDQHAQMRKNAEDTIKREFLLQRMTDDYIQLYKQINNHDVEI